MLCGQCSALPVEVELYAFGNSVVPKRRSQGARQQPPPPRWLQPPLLPVVGRRRGVEQHVVQGATVAEADALIPIGGLAKQLAQLDVQRGQGYVLWPEITTEVAVNSACVGFAA